MKQRFSTFMTTLLLSVFFAVSASAYDVEVDGIYYNLIKKVKSAEVTKGTDKYSGKIDIPEIIIVDDVEYIVKSIGNGAFKDCYGLTSVNIPNSVTSIGGASFEGCYKLTSIAVPNSVTSIGNYAFYECSSLTSIIIGNSVTSIGEYTFYNCNNLASISIPNSVTSIGNGIFSGCSNLASVSISNSVTSIGEWTFYNCSSLTSMTIPNSVTSIGDYAFDGCSNLNSISIPNSVSSIGSLAFNYCSSLTSITIPNSVTSIGVGAFSSCTGLTSITIPNSVTSIGQSTFSGCSKLSSITIPNSVTSIGESTFSGCSNLTSITIPNSVTSIGSSAFNYCSSLTSITIPNSVTSIGSSAFKYCSSLTSITNPNSVTSIKSNAFYGCKDLENVYCYAIKVPYTETEVFKDSYIEYATLHIPASSINTYKNTAPWRDFGTFKALEGTESKKCETPTILYNEGELTFACATENVEFVSEVKNADIKKNYTEKVTLTACYDISVTAMKTGYENSDVATAKLCMLTDNTSDTGNINTAIMRGVMITSSSGFITIYGLASGESVSFYTTDGKPLGIAKSIDGIVSFSAKQGSVVVAKIGNESVEINME